MRYEGVELGNPRWDDEELCGEGELPIEFRLGESVGFILNEGSTVEDETDWLCEHFEVADREAMRRLLGAMVDEVLDDLFVQ